MAVRVPDGTYAALERGELGWSDFLRQEADEIAAAKAVEAARREALGDEGRRFEDYGHLWAEMQRGEPRHRYVYMGDAEGTIRKL